MVATANTGKREISPSEITVLVAGGTVFAMLGKATLANTPWLGILLIGIGVALWVMLACRYYGKNPGPMLGLTVVVVLMSAVSSSHPQSMQQVFATPGPTPTPPPTASDQNPVASPSRNNVYVRDVAISPPPSPAQSSVTYDYRGGQTEFMGMSKQYVLDDRTLVPLERMESLFTDRNWSALRDLCEQQIKELPDWPTPYYFYGIAIGQLGDIDNAIERLEDVKKTFPGVFNNIDHWIMRFRATQAAQKRKNSPAKGLK